MGPTIDLAMIGSSGASKILLPPARRGSAEGPQSRAGREDLGALPEFAGAREALRRAVACATAGAAPGRHIDLGAGAVLAVAPGEPIGEPEHLGVREPARAIALQDDAAAARHL